MTRATFRMIGLATMSMALAGLPEPLRARQGAPEDRGRSSSLKESPDRTPAHLDLYGDPLPPRALVRFGTVRHRQETPIRRIAYSPKGRFLLTDGEDPYLRVWDARDGRFLRRIDVGTGDLRVFAPSSDDKRVAVARYWFDPETVRFLIDVVILEMETGRRVIRGPWGEQDNVSVLEFSPDGQILAVGTTGGILRLRDIRTGDERARSFVGRRRMKRIAFAPSGKRLAVLSAGGERFGEDHQVDIIDVTGREKLRVIPEHVGVENIAFSTDEGLIAASGAIGPELWEVSSGRRIGNVFLFGNRIAFSGDGRILAASNGSTFSFWDLVGERIVGSFEPSSPAGNAWALAPDGSTIAANGGSTVLHYWDVTTFRDRIAAPAEAHQDRVNVLRFTDDGKTLISGGDDRTVQLWDVASRQRKKVMGLAGKPQAFALSPDGKLLLAAARDHNWLFLWDLSTGAKPVILLDGYSTPAFPIAVGFSGQDGSIVSCWSDGKIRSWGREDHRKKDVARQPRFAPFGHDTLLFFEGNRFASGVLFAAGGKVAVIEPRKGLHVADLAEAKGLYQFPDAKAVAVSPDDRSLAIAVGPHDRRPAVFLGEPEKADPQPSDVLVILNVATGKESRRIPIRPTEVWSLAFSPDGKFLASTTGRDRGSIRLHDLANGREIGNVPTAMIGTPALAFTPDGSMLATGMADTSVLLWDPRPDP
ncbi:MAG: WD40 repeat domain-containing protein [Isosphaeraceae bacterium]